MGSLTEEKGESKLSADAHLSLLSDYRHNVISGFKFLLPCLPYHAGLHSQTLNQNKPYCQIFYHSNKISN